MKANCRFAMAVHVLTVLAHRQGDRVSSASLASSVNTHPVIIRRVLLALQRARLVETQRGPGFGSRLARSPERINLAEVYMAVERADPFILPPRRANQACPVGQGIETVVEKVFMSAREALERSLASTTLAEVHRALTISGTTYNNNQRTGNVQLPVAYKK